MGSETYVNGADKVLVPHEYISHAEAKNDGTDPGADKAFDGLFRRELDELGAAKCHAAYVGEDVVGYNEGCWEEEPDHAFKDIVHDEVRLHNDQV